MCKANKGYAEESIRAGTLLREDHTILGIRYKSMVRANYDLCETCEAREGATSTAGPFMKLRTPLDMHTLNSKMEGFRYVTYS
jgi:hypothetical protein